MPDTSPSSGGSTADSMAPPAARCSRLANAGLVLASVLLSLALIETGYRLAAGLPLFKLANWRTELVVMNRLDELKGIPDAVLGWTLQPWSYNEDGYTTIDHGIRQNFDETTVRTGAVLAVGDSFTEGWDVADSESWPAYLEKLTGVAVVNAGIGGYGTDQIVLRAEQLLPIVKPKILIVGFLEADIFRAGHSIFGAPKPYFTLEGGELRYHPPEQIERRPQVVSPLRIRVRDALGYSAAADHVLARLAPNYWYGGGTVDYFRKAGINEAEVTCALLRRLKTQTEREGIRMMLFMQHHAPLIARTEKSTYNAQYVIACAQAAGIRVLDQFASLRAIVLADPNALRDLYVGLAGGELYGHMTAKGNEHAANLIAPALRDWLAAVTGASQTAATPAPAATEHHPGAAAPAK
ncbi:MAG: hypothetical protein QOI12_4914 [Alphaproteobacteria bacterium]|nr:hypothetical protein [Alphaproteobacteria bacterium]